MAFLTDAPKEATLAGNHRLLVNLLRLAITLLVLNLALFAFVGWRLAPAGAPAKSGKHLELLSQGETSTTSRHFPLANTGRIELYADGVLQEYHPVSTSKAQLWAANELVSGKASRVEIVHRITYTNPGGAVANRE